MKKPKRRAQRATQSKTPSTPEMIERKAREDLAAGHHRDAIAGFKQLLKQEQRADWQASLADAYAGRARELAAKGMLKEAVVMWDNRAAIGLDLALDADQAALLLRLNRIEPILDQLSRPEALPNALRERLRALIAARILGGDPGIAERLDPEDPVRRHAEPARAALLAYCGGDEAGVRSALNAIPFRSPYRDWVQIIKALQALPDAPAEASRLLERIDAGSAFGAIKEAAALAMLPESVFLERMRTPGPPGARLRLACTLRGWTPERIAVWTKLQRLGERPKPEGLLRFIQTHRDALGGRWSRRHMLPLLVEHFPISLQWLTSAGAAPASTEETQLINAWQAEQAGDLWDIAERWAGLAEALERRPVVQRGANPSLSLRIALILRRADAVGDILSTRDARGHPGSDLHDLVCEQVEESLQWDPDDRDTHLRLIGFYRSRQRLKDARRLLDAASRRWPDDIKVLQASLDAAIDGGAFKKAAGLARRILAIDPINTGVRDSLVDAHLAHARKQILKRRNDLASKEIAAAEEWARSDQARERIEILSGLNRLREDEPRGTEALRRAAERLGSGLSAQVALALAADPLGVSPPRLGRVLALGKAAARGRDDLLGALQRVRQHLDTGEPLTWNLKEFLGKALPGAPWSELSRGELESACETLRRARLDQVREKVARAALKRWRHDPLFQLHAFEAKYPHGCHDLLSQDLTRLQQALEQAREAGDTRTALRIQEALNRSHPFGIGPDPFGMPPDDDFDEDFDEDFPLGDGSAAEVFLSMVEILGLDKALDALGMPPDIKREILKSEREIGRDGVLERMGEFFEYLEGLTDGAPPIPPPRAPATGRNRKGKKRQDKPTDDDSPDQLDLFS